MTTATPIKKPYGHRRDVFDASYGEREYRIIGPEGVISWRLREDGRYDGAVVAHVSEQKDNWLMGPTTCAILGGVCWWSAGHLMGDRARSALRISTAALWAYLEKCYSQFMLVEDEDAARAED